MRIFIKTFTIFITCFFIIKNSIAQSQNQNDLKYWKYHERLLNDFMVCVCSNDGGSLPASTFEPLAYKLSWG